MQSRQAADEARSSVVPGLARLHVEITVGVRHRAEDAIGDRNAGSASVGHDELATQVGTGFRVQQDDAPVRAAHAPRNVMLEQQQIVEIVRRYEGRRADIDQPSLDQLERGMGAQLLGVRDHLVAAEPAGYDGPQQPGGWLDGERDRHGRQH